MDKQKRGEGGHEEKKGTDAGFHQTKGFKI